MSDPVKIARSWRAAYGRYIRHIARFNEDLLMDINGRQMPIGEFVELMDEIGAVGAMQQLGSRVPPTP